MDLISIDHSKHKAFTVSVRKHQIITDMHCEDGGEDTGPNPTELFAASLGTCIGMIAYEYCIHHDLPAEGISLSVVPQLADNPKRIQAIAIDLTMPAGFPENRRAAIKNAARACVITNTLQAPPELDLEID